MKPAQNPFYMHNVTYLWKKQGIQQEKKMWDETGMMVSAGKESAFRDGWQFDKGL